MSTARDALFDELRTMFPKGRKKLDGEGLRALLTRYRIQMKGQAVARTNTTAREELALRFEELVQQKPTKKDAALSDLLTHFRMQHKKKPAAKKASGTSKKQTQKSPSKKANAKNKAARKTAETQNVKVDTNSSKAAAAEAALSKESWAAEPFAIGGGPMRNVAQRATCPKCKSEGVTIVKDYGEEPYYACIYCGWQHFGHKEQVDQDEALARSLLED